MKIILYFLFLYSVVSAQDYSFEYSFGKFNSASSFYISAGGFIYVTDSGTDEIIQLDTVGKVIKEAGGYGWEESSFDNPSDIYANTLSVYVSDLNNHRVQRFDKDLNFVSSISTRESTEREQQFGYPLSCVISNQGDLYILDSENKRVLKFDLFGNFIQNFGSYDAGDFQLDDPLMLSISPNGNIFILDKQRLLIFDQYGNGIAKTDLKEEYRSLKILFRNITINDDRQVLAADLGNPELVFNKLNLTGLEAWPKIVSSIIFNGKLYLLTPNEILLFHES